MVKMLLVGAGGRRFFSPEIKYHIECKGDKNESDYLGKGKGTKNHETSLITSERFNDQPPQGIEKSVEPNNLAVTFLEPAEAHKNSKDHKGLK